MNSSKFKPPRLYLYYNYVSRFDLLDKQIHVHKFLPSPLQLRKLVVKIQLPNPIPSKTKPYHFFILSELSTQQRPLLTQPPKKFFFKTFSLKTTVRKEKFANFLDIFTNSVFLTKPPTLKFQNNYVNSKLTNFFCAEELKNLNFILFNRQLESNADFVCKVQYNTERVKLLKTYNLLPLI